MVSVIRAATVLNGERNAPELPIPTSAIERYAQRFNMSDMFVALVREYDNRLLNGIFGKVTNGGKIDKTAKKLL